MKKKRYRLKIDIDCEKGPEHQRTITEWLDRSEVAAHLRAAASDFEANDFVGRAGFELGWKQAAKIGRKLGKKAKRNNYANKPSAT